jgi:hypothetical protein
MLLRGFTLAGLLAVAACGGASRPPLTYAEQCAENGLILSTTKGAEASGVVGSVFAGSGSAHSCDRPATLQHHCEVQANSYAATVKRTHNGTEAQIVAYANQVRWHYYTQCMNPQSKPQAAR